MTSSKKILITGGSRGLGKALGYTALLNNDRVVLTARGQEGLQAAKNELTERALAAGKQPDCTYFACNLSLEKDVDQLFHGLGPDGQPDILINNAATWMGLHEARNLSTSLIHESLKLNFFSAFHCTQSFLTHRPHSSPGATIINIGATASMRGGRKSAAYSIAKGALRSYSQSLAKELGTEGIHVAHVVLDGLLDNERTRSMNPGAAPDNFMNLESVSGIILQLAAQEKSAWTFEMDLRPYNESF